MEILDLFVMPVGSYDDQEHAGHPIELVSAVLNKSLGKEVDVYIQDICL